MKSVKKLLRKLALLLILKWVGDKAPEVREILKIIFLILEEL